MNKNADSITPLQVLFIAISWLALLSYSEKKRKENSEINSIVIKLSIDFAMKSRTGTIRRKLSALRHAHTVTSQQELTSQSKLILTDSEKNLLFSLICIRFGTCKMRRLKRA